MSEICSKLWLLCLAFTFAEDRRRRDILLLVLGFMQVGSADDACFLCSFT